MTPPPALVSIVLSFRNEAANIPALVERLAAMFADEPVEYELLFVNDDSTDASLELLLNERAANPRVKIVNMSRRFGVAEGVLAGMTASRGDAVIYMDADLQDPPELVPELVARWREGYEVVYAVRERREGDGWLKRHLAAGFYRLLRRLSNVDIPVDVGDFRLVDRRALDAFRSMRERNRYVRGMFSWIGFRQIGVPYSREQRYAGEPKYSFRKSLRLAVDGIVSFSDLPLRTALVVGFLFSVASFVVGIGAIVAKIAGAFVVPGWASLLVVVSFLGGIQLTVIGMTGLYIGRIYEEVKARPLYVIREAHGLANVSLPTDEAEQPFASRG